MDLLQQRLPFLLTQVERPGRYTGNEINVTLDESKDSPCRVCLVYPDTYEVGMPFIGHQILYHILNRDKRITAERCFSPWVDMEELLRQNRLPLFSLESKRGLNTFDIVGFTLQYEMTYTNILNILDLSHIPLFSDERSGEDPYIFAGGSCAFNPEPLADFVDVFVIGDAEEILPELCGIIREMKKAGASRREILRACSLPGQGVYVPGLYDPASDGPVRAAKIPVLNESNYPSKPIVPLIEIAQDRFAMEIQRGCGAGCRFCHAGIIYRPVREREPEALIRHARETLGNTGFEEISLLSLSTSDYSRLAELVQGIQPYCDENHIGISFPSLRLDSFNVNILEAAGSKRRSGLTFAPEAGTQRLRNVINKKINEEDLFSSVRLALEHKWRTLKFYFMVGLPTETDEDLQGIVDLIVRIRQIALKYPNTQINVSLSSFIPKAHTPFQWAEHLAPEELTRRIYLIRNQLKYPGIKIMHRDPEFSVYESLLSRGDRSTGKVVYGAWKHGAKLDAWSEMFNQKAWDLALEESGIVPGKMIGARDTNARLPWSFVHSGVDTAFLKEEKERAERGEITQDCRTYCESCGVCDKDLKTLLAMSEKAVLPWSPHPEDPNGEDQPQSFHTLRLHYEKNDMMRYIGHHDFLRLFERMCNILHWPVRYSSGFNRRPRIAAGYPVPMGYDAGNEAMDILLNSPVENPRDSLNAVLPPGIRILSAECTSGKRSSVMETTTALCYTFHFKETVNTDAVRTKLEKTLSGDTCIVERFHKKGTKNINLKPFIKSWDIDQDALRVSYDVLDSQTGRPDEFLRLAFDDKIPYFIGERNHITLKE